MTSRYRMRLASALVIATALALPAVGSAQRGGGGGGFRGGGSITRSRLDALVNDFELTKDQKNAIKTILDEAHKNAAPIRDGLTKTHAAIETAIQAGKSDADIDAAVQAYAEQAAAMTAVEVKALADVMKTLNEQQLANNAAISRAFFSLRGAFLDPKKWDDIPSGRLY